MTSSLGEMAAASREALRTIEETLEAVRAVETCPWWRPFEMQRRKREMLRRREAMHDATARVLTQPSLRVVREET